MRPAYNNRANRCLPAGAEKSVADGQENRQRQIFRAGHLNDAQRRLLDDILALFGGHGKTVMAHLIESGTLSLEDLKETEKELRRLPTKEKSQ